MFANITHDTKAEHRRLFGAGVVFITIMALLVAFSIAIYDKVFQHPTWVTIHAENAGLQLDQFGDVRRHGVLVGTVRHVGNDGHQAVIKIALNPSSAKEIPSNATIEILPTTLFGQKYVNIQDPSDPSSTPMHSGEVIPASRVTTNVELQKILADLFPLLRSIRPADLSSTLYAIANALRGRGDKIGATMVELNDYLAKINVHLPTMQEDLALLAKVSNTYAIAAPDLIRILRNATTTAHTVSSKQTQLHTFFTDVTGLGRTSTAILDANGPAIIRAGQLSTPLLGLLDTYSPEFTCLLQGAARYAGRLGTIFKGGRVRQSMTFAATQRPPYAAKDKPVYADHRGPDCYGLPYPKVPLPGPVNFANGTDGETAAGGNPN